MGVLLFKKSFVWVFGLLYACVPQVFLVTMVVEGVRVLRLELQKVLSYRLGAVG